MIIAIGQFNPIVGDILANKKKIMDLIDRARDERTDLLVLPELSLTGYPPKDLVLHRDFIRTCEEASSEISLYSKDIGLLMGLPRWDKVKGKLYNSAVLLEDGEELGWIYKSHLPNYEVFDEARYYSQNQDIDVLEYKGLKLGISIGEDILDGEGAYGFRGNPLNILELQKDKGADIFINLSASPYYYGKQELSRKTLKEYSEKHELPLLYVNQVGANDELIFDGLSMVFDNAGNRILEGNSFKEDLIIYDSLKKYEAIEDRPEDISTIKEALILGLKDYASKTGFKRAILGISGGFDSALLAYLLIKALGKDNVTGVFMPTEYSSEESRKDAFDLAYNLGMELREIPIGHIFHEYLKLFNEDGETRMDLAEENIQARIRGNILMFISNREGRLLLSPSNKSEIAMGYSTLYGDSCGGLSVLGDVLKSQAYDIARHINKDEEIIPNNIIIKAPTAELKHDQKDEDSLPPYPLLDGILGLYLEEGLEAKEIISRGYDGHVVYSILDMLRKAEHKRRQLPPILRVNKGLFGAGRRYPIVNGYRSGE